MSRAALADEALAEIRDSELRSGVVQLFDEAQRAIAAGDVDLVVLAARRLACLYELLLDGGMEPLVGCLVVSDRFLDVATDWKWNRVLILDDSVVLGTTLVRLHGAITARLTNGGKVRCTAVCVDRDQRSKVLLDSVDFAALHERSSEQVQEFSSDVVRALFQGSIPFFSDFPITKPIEVSQRAWNGYLKQDRWFVADVTAPLLGDGASCALAQIPSAGTVDACLSRLDPAVAALVESFKLRSYVKRSGSHSRVRFVPIAMLAPCGISSLDAALEALASVLRESEVAGLLDWQAWLPVAKHRLVQLAVAACVLEEALGDAATSWLPGGVTHELLDPLPVSLYFGPLTDLVLRIFDLIVSAYRDTAKDREPPLPIRLDRPSPSPLLDREGLQDVLWESRELLACSGLPEEPSPGHLTKVGLIFGHAIASVFGYVNREYEEPQRAEIAQFGSVDEYNAVYGEDDQRRILAQGFTMRELTHALAPELSTGPVWSRSLLSLGIDMGNDLGIIVPVTQFDRRRGIVYRCYRLGETAHLAGSPLPRAVVDDVWDAYSRSVEDGYPVLHSFVPIQGSRWRVLRRERGTSNSLETLRTQVLRAVPGRVASRFEGMVREVDGDEFVADLQSWPSSDQRVGIMRSDQVRPEQREMIEPGAAFSWTVFEADYGGALDRTSRIRLRPKAPLDLDRMYRSAEELEYLADSEVDTAEPRRT